MAVGKLTKRTVDACRAGPRDAYIWDEDLKGFGLKITPTGRRIYVYQYRMGGRATRTRRCSIGDHGSPWTPASARNEAERLAILVAQGIDPISIARESQRLATDLAFSSYAERFLASCTGRGWHRMVERTFRLHLNPYFRDKPLPEITRANVAAALDKLPATQAALRRNTFAVIRRMFRWAVARGDLERSPCEGLEIPPPVSPRDRFLRDEELRLVWAASYECNSIFGRIVRMLIVTGQRREEVTGLEWSELNQAEATWVLDRKRSKNGQPHVVPLSQLAVKEIGMVCSSEEWPTQGLVFPTSKNTRFNAHAKGKSQLDRLLEPNSLSSWRLHDLRRTFATGLQRLGVRFEVTEALLNHLSGSRSGVAGIYQRHDWGKEKREAMDAWAGHLSKVVIAGDAE